MILLDTDVMVDVMRRHSPAVDWLDALGTDAVGLPGLVAMELLQGCRNRQEQQLVETVLRPFSLYWPTEADCTRALDDFASLHLSHSIGILDALIAEMAVGLSVELATFDERYYRAVEALLTVQPYVRSMM